MTKRFEILAVVVSAVLFTLLFHQQLLGINVFIFEALFFIWLIVSKNFRLQGLNQVTVGVLTLVTGAATVLVHSTFSIIINFVCLFVFVGIQAYPQVKSIINALYISFYNVIEAQVQFFSGLAGTDKSGKTRNYDVYFKRLGIFMLPLLIIVVFVLIYRSANAKFDELLRDIGTWIAENLYFHFDMFMVLTFLLGLFISNILYLNTVYPWAAKRDDESSTELTRVRKKSLYARLKMSLKNEHRSAIFLLFTLNGILLMLNIIDIKWIWFRDEWEKQYLMQFVHEGTYLLILSILISIAIVLYYFRKNLNFYCKNKFLKTLSYIWLAQNAIMVISVAIRNYRYIEYFALAYKRIGVFIFLALVLYGLFTVMVKVLQRKSAFYLFKTNAFGMLVVLAITSVVNWDYLIAKYNFAHADKASLHLNYMSELSNTALPELDVPLEEVKKMNIFGTQEYAGYFTPQQYCDEIAYRKKIFIKRWEAKSWQEWNWAEYRAYNKLKANN